MAAGGVWTCELGWRLGWASAVTGRGRGAALGEGRGPLALLQRNSCQTLLPLAEAPPRNSSGKSTAALACTMGRERAMSSALRGSPKIA